MLPLPLPPHGFQVYYKPALPPGPKLSPGEVPGPPPPPVEVRPRPLTYSPLLKCIIFPLICLSHNQRMYSHLLIFIHVSPTHQPIRILHLWYNMYHTTTSISMDFGLLWITTITMVRSWRYRLVCVYGQRGRPRDPSPEPSPRRYHPSQIPSQILLRALTMNRHHPSHRRAGTDSIPVKSPIKSCCAPCADTHPINTPSRTLSTHSLTLY